MDFYDMKIFFISFSIQKFQKCSKWKAEMNFTINQLGKFFTPKTSVVLVKCKAKKRIYEGVQILCFPRLICKKSPKSPGSF